MQTNFYFDPNAFVQRPKEHKENKKMDLNHIEQVLYPEPYDKIKGKDDRERIAFSPNVKQEKTIENNNNFDISKLLPLLTGGGNINSLLPSLLNSLGLNSNVMQIFNNFKPVKQVENKVVKEFDKNSISKYKKV